MTIRHKRWSLAPQLTDHEESADGLGRAVVDDLGHE